MAELCATCYFYIEKNKKELINRHGQCRRLPPQVLIDFEGEIVNVWPTVRDRDWCGEHAPMKDDSDEQHQDS